MSAKAKTSTMRSIRLFLDLGDLFTKGLADGPARKDRCRYPSVVAYRLIDENDASDDELLLNGSQSLPRHGNFDPREYRRTRSYPGADEALATARRTIAERPRLAGWLATTYGSGREILGQLPSDANIEALINKALLQVGPAGRSDVELALLVDLGVKAEAIARYAAAGERDRTIEARSFRKAKPRRMELRIRPKILDSAACAIASLPPAIDLATGARVVTLDIGYLRSKLAFLSSEGCEHQEELDGLGLVDCIRRILRDGQDQGLVEDELAVVRALEHWQGEALEIAGRRFDVEQAFEHASASLIRELTRQTQRAITEHYARRPAIFKDAVLLGGGSAALGVALKGSLLEANIGIEHIRIAEDCSFGLLEGARTLGGLSPPKR